MVEMTERNSAHKKAQKEGKKRDLDTCQVCGSTHKVQGHHIVDVKYGGSSNKENIVTLCDYHHKKVHSNKIDISKF
jgi:5-methylcytosine-specific restriction endonuclease McrA